MKFDKNLPTTLIVVAAAAVLLLFSCGKPESYSVVKNAVGFRLDSIHRETLDELQRAKREKNDTLCFRLYSRLSHYANIEGESAIAKAYIDSMEYYKNKFNDPDLHGLYYFTIGNLYQATGKEEIAHEYYLKALDSYRDESSNKINIIYNLSVYYYKHEILSTYKRLTAQAIELAKNTKQSYAKITAYRIAYNYYNTLRKSEESTELNKKIARDSALFYINRVIWLYEEGDSKYSPSIVAYDYAAKAFLLVCNGAPNDSTTFYIDRAAELAANTDTTMLFNLLSLNLLDAMKRGEYDKANESAAKQLDILSKWDPELEITSEYYSAAYKNLIDLTTAIGDYESATSYYNEYLYHTKKLLDREKLEMVESLQQKYESEKQRQKAAQALKEAETNRLIYQILLVLALSLAGLSYFIYRWSRVKRDRDRKTHSLVKLELQELDRSYQLASQELSMTVVKLQMAEIERSSREKDFQSLQERLDNILSRAEKEKERHMDDKRRYHYTLVKNQLLKKTPDSENIEMYHERIDMLCENFLAKLIEIGLTDGEIQYCILFLIKASNEDISKYHDIRVRNISKRKSFIKREYLDDDDERVSIESRLFDLHQQYARRPLPTTHFFDW